MSDTPLLTLRAASFFTPKAYIVADGEPSGQVTFSRGSVGKYYNAVGILKTAAANIFRTSYMQDGTGYFGLLMEPAATNILTSSSIDSGYTLNSSATLIPDQLASPDGTFNAEELTTIGSAGGDSGVYKTVVVTVSSSTQYTFSTYVKYVSGAVSTIKFGGEAGWTTSSSCVVHFNIVSNSFSNIGSQVTAYSSQALANGWYRIQLTATTGGAQVTSQLIVYNASTTDAAVIGVWGLQLETGTDASSQIDTTTVAVTRSADIAYVALGSVSWFSATEGTVFTDFKRNVNTATTTTGFQIDAATVNNSIRVEQSVTSRQIASSVTDAGVSQVAIVDSTGNVNGRVKCAFAFKANDFANSYNAGAVSTDVSGTIPASLVNLRIGYNETGQTLSGVIRDLHYYSTRLSNSSLVTLTT